MATSVSPEDLNMSLSKIGDRRDLILLRDGLVRPPKNKDKDVLTRVSSRTGFALMIGRVGRPGFLDSSN